MAIGNKAREAEASGAGRSRCASRRSPGEGGQSWSAEPHTWLVWAMGMQRCLVRGDTSTAAACPCGASLSMPQAHGQPCPGHRQVEVATRRHETSPSNERAEEINAGRGKHGIAQASATDTSVVSFLPRCATYATSVKSVFNGAI